VLISTLDEGGGLMAGRRSVDGRKEEG